ncbi:MAG: serine O-acetyltransferase EpsC [Chlamydiota bacterium]|nr:serine O-acetyltransferase EpsC [Chlamydiota bacterium]
MGINDWINKNLPDIVGELEKNITKSYDNHMQDGLDFSGRNEIYDILDDIHAALFPGCYSREHLYKEEINFFLGDVLRHISFKLGKHIRDVMRCQKNKNASNDLDCEKNAEKALIHFIESLPETHQKLLLDIQAAYTGDPAAKSLDEIIMSYPCIEAIMTYRISHTLYELDIPIIPRIMSEKAHSKTGIDIHPGASIGTYFFIDHGTGVVIGETCTIGNRVKIYQGVTLGALSFPYDEKGKPIKGIKRHPDIEDDVIIYANATILGGKTIIGKESVIGANTWITQSVPPGSRVYSSQKDLQKNIYEDHNYYI